MSNPARELATIIETWSESGEAKAYVQRELGKDQSGWPRQMRAMRLVLEVEATLRWMSGTGRDVDVFLEALPAWQKVVLHYPHSWQSVRSATDRLDMLKGLAAILDTVAGGQEVDVKRMQNAVDEAEALVRDGDDVDPALREYVAKLSAHIRGILDVYETTGSFELMEALMQLRLFMDAAAHRAGSAERRSSFEKVSDVLRHPFINTNVTGFYALAVGSLPLLLTGGGGG